MFDYELHRHRRDQLIREADAERLARQARKARMSRARGRGSAGDAGEGRVAPDNRSFVRAA
ncbi:hypothetical protein [Streptomyces sp. MUM 178J]|uniref:hypothetical protein n=1 Tax=Streptomyces sp. MUM 178J TaxID=2791991 RepID=UPI001F036FB6|nr:hypothetical protein [Streptomyces sp. MUM 178J]WRQ81078.1 hypothetical protein I3F59_017950 [Streptomyces sp. MUM 178J]